MANEVLTAALKEAYASAPSDTVILHTIELRHPNFVGIGGITTAIRVVKDNVNLVATLEENAPLDGGDQVTFIAYAFDITLPKVDDKSNPEAILTIDNVSSDIVKNIEFAVESQHVINMTYRPYLSTDLSVPQYDPPLHLTLTDITADVYRVSGKAKFGDLANRTFPSELYTPNRFPGLTR